MTADTIGGVWTYALDLARGLARYGVHVELATMGRPLSDAQWAAARALPTLTIHESDYKLEWMDDPWDDVRAAGAWLRRLAQRLRPDLVHLNGYAHAALPWGVPTLVVGHSCVLSWWRAVKGEAAPPARLARYRRAVARGLRAADLVAAPTQAMLDALNAHYGPLPRARVVVPNGRPAHPFTPQRPPEPFVLTVGRLWDEAKNVGALASVAPELAWPIYVAGEPTHPNGGTATLGALRPLGNLAPDELAGWYNRAAIYALPGRYEPFGLSALEAGMAGCALVLGDIPSLREVWGDAALFVPPDDPDRLATALHRLMRDDALRDQMAGRARARAARYHVSRMASGYHALYRHLLRSVEQPAVEPDPWLRSAV